jgi:hypothetical protein
MRLLAVLSTVEQVNTSLPVRILAGCPGNQVIIIAIASK